MIRLFQQFVPRRKVLLVTSESGILFLFLFGLSSLPPLASQTVQWWPPDGDIWRGILSCLAIAVLCQVSLSYNDLYDWRVSQNRRELFTRLLHAYGYALVGLSLVVLVFPGLFYFPGLPRLSAETWKLILILLLAFAGVWCWRIGFHWFFFKWNFNEKILILGTGAQARGLAHEIQQRADTGMEVVGLVGPRPADVPPDAPWPGVVPILGDARALLDLTRQHRASRVVVALEERRGNIPIADLLQCRMAGLLVEERESVYEKIHGKIAVEALRPSYLIFNPGFNKSRLTLAAKRTLDILVSLAGLLLALPLLLLTVLAIRLDSRGPILLRQPRVGQDGIPFIVFKFRSMRADAESRTGPVWASTGDSRITRVGRVIRLLRIDEIPQMWNVLKGEMSFVGPRPERPFFVQELMREIPYYTQRLTVKPGITGWAQICYPYGSSTRDAIEKLQYDLYYIKNMSLLFDLSIILRTIRVVLFREGAR